MGGRIKKRELILMLVLLSLVVSALLVYLLLGLQRGDEWQVVVEIEGREYASLPLDTDTTLRIECEGGYNLLVIEDGRAFIRDADCPGGDCVRHGVIDPDTPLNLRMISCLPHAVTVYLRKGAA